MKHERMESRSGRKESRLVGRWRKALGLGMPQLKDSGIAWVSDDV